MQAPPAEAAERIRRATIQVLQQRLDLLGVDRSGAYEHYNVLLSRGFPIPEYDSAALDLVSRDLPGLRSYHVIGSGLGTLPFMLAGAGFAAVGVERDEARHLTATAILHTLMRQLPRMEGNCRLIGAWFPDAVADIDVAESMAIVTDFVATHSPAEYEGVCRGLARYRYVLLDLQRFCRKRESEREYDALIAELSGHGLAARSEAIDLGADGCYRLFESKLVAGRPEMLRQRVDTADDAKVKAGAREVLARAPADGALREIPTVEVPPVVLPPRPRRTKRKRLGGIAGVSAILVIGLPTLLAIVYYGFVAANQYVTTFEFAVRGPDSDQARKSYMGVGGSAMTPDAFIVSDYINSSQAARDVGQYVDPRRIFSRPVADFATRLDPRAPDDELDTYWRDMVDAQFDIVSGNVGVTVRAFTPRDSLDLANALVATSNTMFGALNADAAKDTVKLADDNLARTEKSLTDSRAAMRAFRARHGLVQPDKVVLANSTLADDMRRELAGLRTQYAATLASSPRSPTLEILKARITAVEGAMDRVSNPQASEFAQPVTPADLEQYESLDVRSQNLEKLYNEALELQQKSYLAAASQQSYLALFVKPRLAQISLYPHRLQSIGIVFLAAVAAWFVGLMITYAVKDHLI